jgi:flagellar protein FlaJ
MPNDILKYAKELMELSEKLKSYESTDPKKEKQVLKKISITAKNLEYFLKHEKPEEKKIRTSKEEEKKYLKDIELTREEVKEYLKRLKKEQKEKEKPKTYQTYKTNFYAKIANYFMENLSFYLIKNYPEEFKNLFFDLKSADIRILSQTYLSIILFSTAIAFPIGTLLAFIFTFNILLSLFIGIILSGLTFAVTYYYPSIAKVERGKRIKQELVFAIVHMAAVAGSGAHPIKIFELLVDSHEYKDIEVELQRILNYINLFGYSLSTSLRAVAATTPSDDFKDLLHGMSSTIETGGDIKDYLKEKAEDALVQYKFDQKKQLEALSTYSDVYTGILIAAPLLFMVTLAILEKISPAIGGIPISLIANLSVFVLLPFLNIIYILFLSSMRSQI